MARIQRRSATGCSTPFGINEGITALICFVRWNLLGAQRLSASTKESQHNHGRSHQTIEVLNAFRHQRRNHSVLLVCIPFGHRMCSTPFGINEGITARQDGVNTSG